MATTALADRHRPHIVSVLQDDLGYYDSGINNPAASEWSANITHLAKTGVTLVAHYAHWHCSPSRRSFLTGRLPLHHGEQQSNNDSDDIDLRMTWISEKLASVGYSCHWYGKWHTGFRSLAHLPFARGFRGSTGSLQTGGAYEGPQHLLRWQDAHPLCNDCQLSQLPIGCNVYGNNVSGELAAPAAHVENRVECLVKGTAASTALCRADAHEDGNGSEGYDRDECSARESFADGTGQQWRLKHGTAPTTCANEYSTDLWGQLAVQAVLSHDLAAGGRLFLHLCFQAIHGPYDVVPGAPPHLRPVNALLWRSDVYVGALLEALEARGMYNETLLLYASDNGGSRNSSNYPLRGEKHSNWEGGLRVTAFVSGGFLPAHVRGTTSKVNSHLVDWYPTFCHLAGANPHDDPPERPLPTDPADPYRNIYGERSYPAVDGVNLWPLLIDRAAANNRSAAHSQLVLSRQVLLAGRYKLLVSQPYFKDQRSGWRLADGEWQEPSASESLHCMEQDVPPDHSFYAQPAGPATRPCLFDLDADEGEREDISGDEPEVLAALWADLNAASLTQRDCSGWPYGTSGAIPGPLQLDGTYGCSPPELLGMCDPTCAYAYWARWQIGGCGKIAHKSHKNEGPICGVPGCGAVSFRPGSATLSVSFAATVIGFLVLCALVGWGLALRLYWVRATRRDGEGVPFGDGVPAEVSLPTLVERDM